MEFLKVEVKNITFNLANPEEIKKKSVVCVKTADLHEKNIKPKPFGLFDPRMGPFDKHSLCKTCSNDQETCPGHFGHIELNTPVFFHHYMITVKKILGCICLHCSELLFDKKNTSLIQTILSKKKQGRLNFLYTYLTTSGKFNKCLYCKEKQYKVFKEKNLFVVKSDTGKESMNAEKVYNILKRIKDCDVEYLGLLETIRPEWLITTVIIVPPPCTHPSVKFASNQRSENDLTLKLVDVIKANNKLGIEKQKFIEGKIDEKTLNEYVECLQFHCFTYIDNNMSGIPSSIHKSGRAFKTIKEILVGKEGLIRQNIIGKRINHSARSVVSPEPMIDIDQLGVPLKICKKLSFPETVNRYNIEKLQKLVESGPEHYPGANTVIKTDGRIFNLMYAKGIKLQLGDTVERHLLTDDIVLFNRQPTLHKSSMMAHFVKPTEANSFRLNPSVCAPYNADFDGDEININSLKQIAAY